MVVLSKELVVCHIYEIIFQIKQANSSIVLILKVSIVFKATKKNQKNLRKINMIFEMRGYAEQKFKKIIQL